MAITAVAKRPVTRDSCNRPVLHLADLHERVGDENVRAGSTRNTHRESKLGGGSRNAVAIVRRTTAGHAGNGRIRPDLRRAAGEIAAATVGWSRIPLPTGKVMGGREVWPSGIKGCFAQRSAPVEKCYCASGGRAGIREERP